jgi:hypothetical protein
MHGARPDNSQSSPGASTSGVTIGVEFKIAPAGDLRSSADREEVLGNQGLRSLWGLSDHRCRRRLIANSGIKWLGGVSLAGKKSPGLSRGLKFGLSGIGLQASSRKSAW